MPLMIFVGNVGYVLVAVIGGVLVTRRAIAIGDVQAFIQYTRQFSHADHAAEQHRQHHSADDRLG